jgi:hypothetical protein
MIRKKGLGIHVSQTEMEREKLTRSSLKQLLLPTRRKEAFTAQKPPYVKSSLDHWCLQSKWNPQISSPPETHFPQLSLLFVHSHTDIKPNNTTITMLEVIVHTSENCCAGSKCLGCQGIPLKQKWNACSVKNYILLE